MIFGTIINDITPDNDNDNDLKYKSTALFVKNSFQFGIYLGIGLISYLFNISVSLLFGKNYDKDICSRLIKNIKKCKFHYLILISLIDILYYLIFFQLITPYSKSYLVTDYFNEAIYLLYLILYYTIFKKANFQKIQTAITFVFFIIGLILMIIGLSLFHCHVGKIESYYSCIDGINNFFAYKYLSIIIAIFISPLLFFIKIFYIKKYMDINNTNALSINIKIYFIKFILSLIIYLIINNAIYGRYNFDDDMYLYWGLYALFNDIYELLLFTILRATNLFFIFVILVFRKIHYNLIIIFVVFVIMGKLGFDDVFLIGPLIGNIFGLISFSCVKDSNLLEIFNEPLYEEEKNEINSRYLINENNENKITDGKNENTIPNSNKTINYDNEKYTLNNSTVKGEYLNEETPDGKDNMTYCDSFDINEKNKIIEENENLKKEINQLKSENNELKAQNKSHNIRISTLQIKIQSLEDTIEKLSEKIAILNEKN